MAISPTFTFDYAFNVEKSAGDVITAAGEGKSWFMDADGLVGRHPRFELKDGWITLYPPDGFLHSLPARTFSDSETKCPPNDKPSADGFIEDIEMARASAIVGGKFDELAYDGAFAKAQRRWGVTRDLKSYSLFVGPALQKLIVSGDTFRFSRDGNGDFQYSVVRAEEMILSAGSVWGKERSGAYSIWQEVERSEAAISRKPYVTVRILGRRFSLGDGDEAEVPPFYVFLARANKYVSPAAFEYAPRALHAAGRTDLMAKRLIANAATCLLSAQTRLL